MRKSSIYLLYVAVNLLMVCLVFVHAAYKRETAADMVLEKSAMVTRLELTDLCLFTDARYARHPAMTDMNSALQDMPMAFEHFPSGSLMTPPPHLKKPHGTY